MDVLSEVLRAVRLSGAIYFDVSARAPWVAETPSVSTICSRVMPAFDSVIPFHIMLDGGCWAQVGDESEAPCWLGPGDAILFPQGDPHFMSSERGIRSEPDLALYYRPDDKPLPFVLTELGGEGESARFVCGYLGCDARPFNPVLSALPRMLHVARSERGDPTVELIRMAVEESANRRAGGETILAKLSELVFVEALRRYVDEQPAESRSWLSGLQDPQVGSALGLMHSRPSEDWTLERLAKEIGVSRSVLSDRFAHYVGEPPMRYLGRWRMQLASRALESPGISIAEVAARVGYQSEAAFNRAFKKYVGTPPGEWRRAHAGEQATAIPST
jgi:AraC-like DNA-binding protein